MQAVTHFWGLRVFVDCSISSIFRDFRYPEAPFWLPFWLLFGSPGPLKKQLKLWYSHICEVWPLPDGVFLRAWFAGALWRRFCLHVFMILGCFELPILRTFGANRCSPRARQRSGEHCAKTGIWVMRVGGGPLEQEKTSHQTWDNQTWARTRPGVPSGTVADIIYNI